MNDTRKLGFLVFSTIISNYRCNGIKLKLKLSRGGFDKPLTGDFQPVSSSETTLKTGNSSYKINDFDKQTQKELSTRELL